MAVPYYDNLAPAPVSGVSCMVEVERIYALDWGRFAVGDWEALERCYEGLPGGLAWFRDRRDCPMWFGDDEDVPPFLWASVEPPGLQVHGVLPEADWWVWNEKFLAATAALPARKFG